MDRLRVDGVNNVDDDGRHRQPALESGLEIVGRHSVLLPWSIVIRFLGLQSCRPSYRCEHPAALVALALAVSTPAGAADLVVRAVGLAAPLGSVGCSLFASGAGFPMDNGRAQVQWLPAQADDVVCRFKGVEPGRYAVSIGHDRNGNQRVDTNFLGLPTEQWGVSNNVRPTMRAPRYEEAAFVIPADAAEWSIEIKVAQ